MNHRESFIQIDSLALASALLALGIPFCDIPFLKARSTKGEHYTFFFQERSTCGTYSTLEMLRAWDDPKFHEDNPEHPFAYIRCAFKNREGLLDKVHQGLDLVVIEKHGKLAILSKDASPELQKKIFSNL